MHARPPSRDAGRPAYRPVWFRGDEAPPLAARETPGGAYRPVFYRARPPVEAPVEPWPVL